MRYKAMAITRLFFLLNSCSSSGVSVFKEEPTGTPLPTSTATQMPTSTPLLTPIAQPSPVVPVLASVSETELTNNGLVFYAVTKTLELDLNVVKCFEGSIDHGYVTYNTDGSLCFYVLFNTEDFPLGKPQEQSGMYMIIAEKGASPHNEGDWAVAVLNSSYLSDDAKRKLKVFNKEVVDSLEEADLLNETIELPKELEN